MCRTGVGVDLLLLGLLGRLFSLLTGCYWCVHVAHHQAPGWLTHLGRVRQVCVMTQPGDTHEAEENHLPERGGEVHLPV